MKKLFQSSIYILIPLIALSASAAQAQVTITEAWVRATVPNQSATGAFMRMASKKGHQADLCELGCCGCRRST